MSNYCDPPFYQQNIYTNTYSLWENSAYYDINNLSPQNFSSSWHRGNDEDFETRYTSGPTENKDAEPPDHRNRRTVEKNSLYEDPDSFYINVTCSSLFSWSTLIPSSSVVWPHLVWQKDDQSSDQGPSNKFQKNLDEMLSKPAKMSKAECMMQKMGWQGGPLGRSNVGIVKPIKPNTVYANNRVGFGKASAPSPKLPIDNNIKHNFTMNILYNIYEFVKNNAEIELLFDTKLTNVERKRVHNIVDNLTNAGDVDVTVFENDAQKEIVLQICDINCYILTTQSEGETRNRKLCIYKEAPLNVYLIIPDDLRDDPPQEDETNKGEQSDNEAEEETNPFLRSITRNLKKTKEDDKCPKNQSEDPPKEVNKISEKILEFFIEFAEKQQYSQFKFLGPFNQEEWSGIRDFMTNAALFLCNGPCKYKEAFDKVPFEIGEDATGNAVINKTVL